jgi:hypothetical protein
LSAGSELGGVAGRVLLKKKVRNQEERGEGMRPAVKTRPLKNFSGKSQETG